MLVTTFIHVTRPSIMQARAERARHIAKMLRIAGRRLLRRFAAWRRRAALARQYERELGQLLAADERMLMDIGVTRGDVIAAAQSRWFTPGRMVDAAARRRRDAMRVAEARRALPRVSAPALSPGAPARLVMLETANYR